MKAKAHRRDTQRVDQSDWVRQFSLSSFAKPNASGNLAGLNAGMGDCE